jgi:hypothetical protein
MSFPNVGLHTHALAVLDHNAENKLHGRFRLEPGGQLVDCETETRERGGR